MSKAISIHTALKKFNLNKEQILAVEAIRNNKIVVLYGEAGTAKSFSAVYAAMKMLANGEIGKISLTRPMVTTERMGFLPGTIEEKYRPYLMPAIEFFNKFGNAGLNTYASLVTAEKVIERPLAFMRGITIEDEVLILDESQNITPDQMLMVLTRIGKGGKIVIAGDTQQDDLKVGETGLDCIIDLSTRLPFIQTIHMTENMRDPIISDIVNNWRPDAHRAQNRPTLRV